MPRIGRTHRLNGVKGSRRIVAPPVGNSVGSVGALLHLPNEEAGHQRMEAAGRHVEHIAATRSVPRQQWGDVGARGQRTCDVGVGDRWSTPEQQLGARRSFKDNPRLMLADRICTVHHFC